MKFINKIKYIAVLGAGMFISCTNMDIPPMNIVGEEDIFGSEAGVMSYLARMYSNIPLEDFRYAYEANPPFNQTGTIYAQPSCLTGEAIGRDVVTSEYEAVGYWNQAYSYIREANIMIETLPEYAENYTEAEYSGYMGEAYFIRAFVYYSLVKRYGGVPVVDKVIDYPASVSLEETMLYRDSEERTWDFIGEDLDRAIEMLPATNPKGRANKYAAAALKSRVMLYAGSIAKYNTVSYSPVNDVRVCGIPQERAVGYFKAAYDASKIVDEGGYRLYTDQWAAGDRQAQIDNFIAIFLDDTYETIFGRYWKDPEILHQYDNSAQPQQTTTGDNNSEINPTLDFVEMFEFDNKDENGHFANFDANGHYKIWESPIDAFDDCEPRLAATVILPMSEFKEQVMDIRRGIWTGQSVTTMGALLSSSDNYAMNYNAVSGLDDLKLVNSFSLNNDDNNLVDLKEGSRYWNELADRYSSDEEKERYAGKMRPSGLNGPVSNWDYGNISGFYVRKFMDPDPDAQNSGNYSDQPWVEIRYAEVLLNRAEAAWELVSLGQSADDNGQSYLSVATECINDIRERGGATLLTGQLTSDIDSREIIRKERRKELAFENKTYWDLKRWRVLDTEEEQLNRKYRILMPFYSVEDDAYFFDVKYSEPRSQNGVDVYDYIYNFDPIQYYQQIPTNETVINPNCRQNPGY